VKQHGEYITISQKQVLFHKTMVHVAYEDVW